MGEGARASEMGAQPGMEGVGGALVDDGLIIEACPTDSGA